MTRNCSEAALHLEAVASEVVRGVETGIPARAFVRVPRLRDDLRVRRQGPAADEVRHYLEQVAAAGDTRALSSLGMLHYTEGADSADGPTPGSSALAQAQDSFERAATAVRRCPRRGKWESRLRRVRACAPHLLLLQHPCPSRPQGDAAASNNAAHVLLTRAATEQWDEAATKEAARKAQRLFARAEEAGVAHGRAGLGVTQELLHGDWRSGRISESSVEAFRKGAKEGSSAAAFNLALVHLRDPQRRDFRAAHTQLAAAAQRGSIRARYALGKLHLHGVGTSVSCPAAVEAFQRVAQQGHWCEPCQRPPLPFPRALHCTARPDPPLLPLRTLPGRCVCPRHSTTRRTGARCARCSSCCDWATGCETAAPRACGSHPPPFLITPPPPPPPVGPRAGIRDGASRRRIPAGPRPRVGCRPLV